MTKRLALLALLILAHVAVVGCGARTPLGEPLVATDAGGTAKGTDSLIGIDFAGASDVGGRDAFVGVDARADLVTGTDVVGGVDIASGSDASAGTDVADLGGPGSADGGACGIPSVTGAPVVNLMTGTVTPAGTGGTITSGRWLLQAATLQIPVPIPFTGTIQSVLEIDALDATSGTIALHLAASLMAAGLGTVPFEQGGVGDYTTAANIITIATNQCAEMSPIGMAEYSIEADSSLTLYITVGVMGLPVQLEASYTKS